MGDIFRPDGEPGALGDTDDEAADEEAEGEAEDVPPLHKAARDGIFPL